MMFSGKDRFFSYTDTSQEISIVLDEESIKEFPEGILKVSPNYFRALELYSMTPQVSLIHSVSNPLAKAGVSIFYLSTYETDFTLIKEEDLELALNCLKIALPSLSINNNNNIKEEHKSKKESLMRRDNYVVPPIGKISRKTLKLSVSSLELVLASVQKKILPFIGMSILKLIFFSHSPQRFISYCLANNNISMILPTNDYETLIETAESVGFNLSSFSETWKRITVDEGPLGFG